MADWSKPVRVNGTVYPNADGPSEWGHYHNGYDIQVAETTLKWTEWTSENKEIKENIVLEFKVRGAELE